MNTPLDFDFFMIGNVEKCKPCRLAHDRLKKFIKSHKEFTFSEWHFDWEAKSVVPAEAKAWLKEQKSKNPELKNHKTIPMVWVNGKFIGGRSELFKVLDRLEK